MRISLIYFHHVREAMGKRDEAREFGEGTTVGGALELLANQTPALAPHLASLMTSVNEELVPRDRVLMEGDRLALLPPFSGG